MKLKITEESWGINRLTGKSNIRKTDERLVDCVSGEIIVFDIGRRTFHIDSVYGGEVTVSVRYPNSIHNKTWTLKGGEGCFYRPMSMDGGYQYTVKVI